jgi:hypothetical protein
MPSHLVASLAVVVAAFAASAVSADITVDRSDKGAVVKIDGHLFTEYLIRSGNKPILWPIIGPTGKPMTRAYPVQNTGKEASDHPHHRSLWFTHGNVNGVDFWGEYPADKLGGVIKHTGFLKIASGKPALIVTRNDWLAPDGKKLCEDKRTFLFDTDGDARWIDVDVAIKASDGPVTFGDTKEGIFGVRVAETLRVDAKRGGHIVNSEHHVDEAAAWGKRAAWVDYHGPMDGQTVGIAILNHPRSFRFPTYWHVRGYGLFAANPFGVHDFTGGEPGRGAVTLSTGETIVLRYRVLLHRGDEKAGKVAESFATYAKQK